MAKQRRIASPGTENNLGSPAITVNGAALAYAQAARLAAIVLSSPDAMITNDLDGMITSWNPAAEELYGYGAEEMIGTNMDLLVPEEHRGEQKRLIKRLLGGQSVERFETQRRRRDGGLVDVALTLFTIRGEEGEPVAISVLAQDITERKLAAQDLAESEARYRMLAETSSLGILVSRNDERDDAVLVVNPACVKIFGASSTEDLIGKSLFGLFHMDSRQAVRELLKTTSGDVVPFVDAQIIRADGTVGDVTIAASPMLERGMAAFNIVLRDVSETKRLLTARAHLAAIIDSSPDAIITGTIDDTVTSWNPAAEALYGYTEKEMLGNSIDILGPPGNEDKPRDLTNRVLAGDIITQHKTQRTRKDGSLIDVALTLFPIRDAAGSISEISVVAQDITRQKCLERERIIADKFFRDTFEHADVGIAHVGIDGRWLRVNQRLCEMLGYTREELLSTTFAIITHPDDVEENLRSLKELSLSNRDTYATDKRYLRRDGSIIWAHLNVALIRREDGSSDYNIAVMTDISDRKRTDELLRKSEEKYRNLFNNSEVGMFRTRLDGSGFVDLNDKYLEILGYAREEIHGRSPVALWVDPMEREVMVRTLEKTGEVIDLEFDLLTKLGDVKRCLTSVRLDRDAGVIEGSIIDITERKRAAELLAQQSERIAQTLNSAVDIASSIVELRDPYTAGHQQRVSELAVRIAEGLRMSDSEVGDIRVAGVLHDMGKAAIPTEILSKPGKLSPTEFSLIKAHAEAGYRLAVAAKLAEPISEMIYQHHERLDGSGYPRELAGKEISIGSRVLAVADVMEAMMSHRPYRPALGIEAALEELERGAGVLYDAEVVKICADLFLGGHFEFRA